MKLLKQIPYLFIILLIGYIIFLRECTPPCTDTYTTDTIVYRDTTYVPKLDTLVITDTLYLDSIIREIIERERIDTVYIVRDYFKYKISVDTILNDSNGFIVVMDTLYRNSIKSRYNQIKLYPQLIKPTLKTHLFIGGGLTGGRDRLGITGQVGLLSKRGQLYTGGYDFINKEVNFSIYIKIF